MAPTQAETKSKHPQLSLAAALSHLVLRQRLQHVGPLVTLLLLFLDAAQLAKLRLAEVLLGGRGGLRSGAVVIGGSLVGLGRQYQRVAVLDQPAGGAIGVRELQQRGPRREGSRCRACLSMSSSASVSRLELPCLNLRLCTSRCFLSLLLLPPFCLPMAASTP